MKLFLSEAFGTGKHGFYAVDPWQGRVALYQRTEERTSGQLEKKTPVNVSEMIPPERAFQLVCDIFRRQYAEFDPATGWTIWASPFEGGFFRPGAPYSEGDATIRFLFARNVKTFAGNETYDRGNSGSVNLDSRTGAVTLLSHCYLEKSNPPPNPRISEQQAREIALGSMKSLAEILPSTHSDFGQRRVFLAYIHKVRASFEATSDYPNCRIPVWQVTLIWSDEPPDMEKTPYCGGHETGVLVHAVTGEVLDQLLVFGTDIPVVKIDQAYLDYYAKLPKRLLPWSINIGRQRMGSRGYFYPLPVFHERELYVKDTFAWLLGVRVELDEKGYSLRGVQDVLLPRKAALLKDGHPWFPLGKLAEASRAKVQLDKRERWLKIDPQYPRVGW